MTVPATLVRMESARMESTSTNVCAALDIQVCLTMYLFWVNTVKEL